MKKQILLLINFLTFFSFISCMEESHSNLEDFFAYLTGYNNTQDEDIKDAMLLVYKGLSSNDKEIAQEQLNLFKITVDFEQPQFTISSQLTDFNDKLQEWEVLKIKSTFQALLDSYEKIKDSTEKSIAENAIQGILSEYSENSFEFRTADEILSKHHQKNLLKEQGNLEVYTHSNQILKKQLEDTINKTMAEEVSHGNLLSENTKLKEEYEQLELENKHFASEVELMNKSQNIAQLEKENQDLNAEYKKLLEEIEDLKKKSGLKFKDKKRKHN